MITKYGHACLFIDRNDTKIVIDPGEFTQLPDDLSKIAAVFVTHPHGDHLDRSNLEKIVAANPDCKIYAVQAAIEACGPIDGSNMIVVDKDMIVEEAGYEVSLYHIDHAVIYQQSPCKNLALKIDDELYYPGDSFHVIPDAVRVVAVPVGAPWLKASEFIDFALAMNAQVAFPTHTGLLNDAGHGSMNNWLEKSITPTGMKFVALKNGESV